MARIAGIDIPTNQRGVISLTYISGIGNSTAAKILDDCGVDQNIKVSDWTDEQTGVIRAAVTEIKVEGALRS